MPQEWRFGVRSIAWPNRCATAEGSRLRADVTDAFVDRTPIDWAALLMRVRTPADRGVLENLRWLDLMRRPARPLASHPATHSRRSIIARLVVVLAAVQTACSFAALGLALAGGHAAVFRTSQIVLALAFAAAGLLVCAATSRDRRSLFLLATFAAAASAFARAALSSLPPTASAPLDFVFRGLFPEAFVPAALWQLAVDFPRVRRFTRFDVFARRASAFFWLLGIAVFTINVATAYHVVDSTVLVLLERDHPSNIFWHLFALVVVPAIGVILVRSRRAPSPERRKVARFAMVFAAGTAPFLLCGLLRMALPGVDEWFLTALPPERLWLDALIVGALTATPILSTVVVLVDRPFDFQAIFSHPSFERIADAGLTALVAASFATLFLSLYQLRHVAIADVAATSRAWIPLLSMAAGCLLVLARPRLLDALAYGGFRQAVDHRERLAAALERVRVARGPREVSVVLRRELRRGLGAGAVQILVPTRSGDFVDPSSGTGALGPDTALMAMLGQMTTPLDFSDPALRRLLPQRDCDWLSANGVDVAAPLKRRDGTIAAIIVFGRWRGDRRFDRRDRWLVTTLTSAAAGVWDGAEAVAAAWDETGDRSSQVVGCDDDAAFECRSCGVVGESLPLACSCGIGAAVASLPRRVGRTFIVERRVGAGGMGVVYLARDTALDREVALKTLPDLRDGTVAHLRNEARAMAALNHETLATIYGLELWRRTPVLVVEYFPGGTLAHRIEAGRMPAAVVVALAIRLARALVYMHEKGVLHRDLKPSNIAFTATGTPKLLDFGLATLIGSSMNINLSEVSGGHSRLPAGTRAYLPPEAYQGAQPDPAFDLWALSVVMLEAITGRNPFATATHLHAIGKAADIDLAVVSALPPRTPPLLIAFFERALALRPELRFQTSLDMQCALDALVGVLGW